MVNYKNTPVFKENLCFSKFKSPNFGFWVQILTVMNLFVVLATYLEEISYSNIMPLCMGMPFI